jgi:SpoVK/Ycf46/Vps4 family AAA+-type ATPase
MDSRLELEEQMGDDIRDTRTIRQKREVQAKLKVCEKKCARRMALTKQAGSWIPRLERMVSSRNLCEFEKKVLLTLIGNVIQPNKIMLYSDYSMTAGFTVGELLRLFCVDLANQIKSRMYFYKTASLVREGMIIVHASGLSGDPTGARVEIDRRMLDFCVGLDTEFSEIVEGSHLYYPKTKFESVVLSREQKDLILKTVSNFESYKSCRKRFGLDDAITYGAGMVMLFHGPPGTGKTMMANALANKLQKKVLLINFPSLGSMTAGENFKFIFREAKINDAILFFDECEAIFETREHGGHDINMLLTEIERHDGLIIMATNRPYDLDEAMHRRIMLAIEFRKPDHLLRKNIWESHIPESMPLADDVDTNELAMRFELSGGFIKNAVLSALSLAVSRDGDHPTVKQDDLFQGATLQLRGHLKMKEFDRRVVPSCGLDEVIVDDDLAKSLRELVEFEKARSVMFGQWGFGKRMTQGVTALFHGVPGTGKSLAAEAVGYEVGRPLKVVNCGELLSKWVGESTKNIDSIFEEGRNSDAILVFDEAEGLFGSRTDMSTSTDRYANVDVGVLLYHIERYPGIVILTTNLIDNIDKAFFRRLKFILHFKSPSRPLRAKLWKLLIPAEAPVADDINFEELSYPEMNGGDVKGAVFKAASRAALRPAETRKITMKDLQEAAQEEVSKTVGRPGFRRQDSEHQGMYN